MLATFIDILTRFGPGCLGSFFAVFWSKEPSKLRRLALWVGGSVFAGFSATQIAPLTHLSDGFVLRFIVGVSCMAFFAKCFDTWQTFNAGGLLRDVVRHWAKLPPATTKPLPLDAPRKE